MTSRTILYVSTQVSTGLLDQLVLFTNNVLSSHYRGWLRRKDLNQRFPAYETGEDDRTPLHRNCIY
jgi:hypothetical protein